MRRRTILSLCMSLGVGFCAVADGSITYLSQSRYVTASNDKGSSQSFVAEDYGPFASDAEVSWDRPIDPEWRTSSWWDPGYDYDHTYSAGSGQTSSLGPTSIEISGRAGERGPFFCFEPYSQEATSYFEVTFQTTKWCLLSLTVSISAYGDAGGTNVGSHAISINLPGFFSAQVYGECPWGNAVQINGEDYPYVDGDSVSGTFLLPPGVHTLTAKASADGGYSGTPATPEPCFIGVGGGGYVDYSFRLDAVFTPDTTLTVNAINGAVTVTPEKTSYTHGEPVTLEALPNPGYYFTEWSGDLTGSANPTMITMERDKTITAHFAAHQQTLTVSAGSGGAVTAPGQGAFQYDHGASVPILAVAEVNHHFTGWTGTAVDAGRVVDPDSANTTLTVDSTYTLQANFAIDQRTLVILSAGGGSVSSPGEGAFQYDHGTTVPLIAGTDTGYRFVKWTGTGVDAGKVADPTMATTTVTIDADYTLQAHFAVDRRTVTVSATAGGSVLAPGEGTFEYDHGQIVALQAQADPLFTFVGWRGSVSTGENPYSLTMDSDQNLTAHFESVLDVLYVDDDAAGDPGPGDPDISDPQENGTAEHPFDRVQEAIEVARAGVRISVRPGTYFETIDLLGKSIEVSGLNADDASILPLPVIDGAGKDTVVRFTHGEDLKCVLQGLVITGGRGWQAGGVLCLGSSPTILNCLIVGNRATALDAGGGIYCQDSKAMFVNCTISGNGGGSAGAGVYLSNSDAVVLDSIVWANTPTQIKLLGSASSLVAYTTVAGGWPGDGNLRADPLFVLPGYWADPANLTTVLPATDPLAVWVEGDYHLTSQAGRWDPISVTWVKDPTNSPCLDAGAPESPIGLEPVPNGSRINMGVYGGTRQASKSATDN